MKPVILRKQAEENPYACAKPCYDQQRRRIRTVRKNRKPDIEQQYIKYRHRDRGNHKSQSGPPFNLRRIAPKCLHHPRNQMEGIAAAQNERQYSKQKDCLISFCIYEKYNCRNQIKYQISNAEYRLANLRHTGFCFFFQHGRLLGVGL